MLWLVPLFVVGAAVAVASSSGPSTPAKRDVPVPPAPPGYDAIGQKFAEAEARGKVERDARTAESKREADKYINGASSALAFLGPLGLVAGGALRALFEGGFAIGKALANLFSKDPGWNSDANAARAKAKIQELVSWGIAPPTVTAGVTDDWDSWANICERDIGYLHTARLASPSTWNRWLGVAAWTYAHPDNPYVQDVIQVHRGFPVPMESLLHPNNVYALCVATLVAASQDVNPEVTRRAVFAFLAAARKSDPSLFWQDGRARLFFAIVAQSQLAITVASSSSSSLGRLALIQPL